MPTLTTKSARTGTARLPDALIALSLACAFGIFAFAGVSSVPSLIPRSV
jgi:hypothetical protein